MWLILGFSSQVEMFAQFKFYLASVIEKILE